MHEIAEHLLIALESDDAKEDEETNSNDDDDDDDTGADGSGVSKVYLTFFNTYFYNSMTLFRNNF